MTLTPEVIVFAVRIIMRNAFFALPPNERSRQGPAESERTVAVAALVFQKQLHLATRCSRGQNQGDPIIAGAGVQIRLKIRAQTFD